MTFTVSFKNTINEVRRNKKPDRACRECTDTIQVNEHYVHSVIFPEAYEEYDFHHINWHTRCVPIDLWSLIHAKMCGDK